MYHCSLLAALVGISCNTSTQTFTVPTEIAVTCICMTVFDKGSHINLEKKKGGGGEREQVTLLHELYKFLLHNFQQEYYFWKESLK